MLPAAALAVALFLAGCGGPSAPSGPQQERFGDFSVTLETRPSPPVSKQNVLLRIWVSDAEGQPVADAEVTVSLTMPGMSHGDNTIRLSHREGGLYEGEAIFVMAGRWAADVTVDRPGQRAGGRFMLQLSR